MHLGVLLSLVVAFQWGLMPIILKQMLTSFPTPMVFVLSWFLYSCAMLAYIFYKWDIIKPSALKLKLNHVLWVAVSAIGCSFAGHLLYYHLLEKHDSYIVIALVNAAPFVTLLLAALYLKEDVTVTGFAGVLLIVLGVVCIVLNERRKLHRVRL